MIGLAVFALGLMWFAGGRGILVYVGLFLIAAGGLLIFAGVQRARFRMGDGGRGVVQVIEGQVTYFGPLNGGTVSIADLIRVELDATAAPNRNWVLHDPAAPLLQIPVNAEGAEALFDAFTGLQGLKTEKMLAELQRAPPRHAVIWQSKVVSLH
jgi:hypothetical protein